MSRKSGMSLSNYYFFTNLGKVFNILDLQFGYHPLSLYEKHIVKTTFRTLTNIENV
jgi:hypothetical protein